MLNALYSFSLHQPITEKLVVLSKLDGVRPSLICCTVGGKIFVHSPHEGSLEGNAGNEVKFLNINKNICALTTGIFDPSNPKEMLVVASHNTLIAYDVEKNSDLFYKEIPDGINTLSFGFVKTIPKPLLFVGGNCSIQGFDQFAEEQYWTVTGDNVSAICFCDVDGDGFPELIVGSDDFALRAFKNEDILFEVGEAARITQLLTIKDGHYAYALDNGTLGVYRQKHRLWRVKAKHKVVSLVEVATEAEQTVHSLVIGWSNGRVEVRADTTGEVLYKLTMDQPVAKILKGDYRMDDTMQVIVVTTDGNVRGYGFDYSMRGASEKPTAAAASTSTTKQMDSLEKDLLKKKNELMMELNQLTENKKTKPKSSTESSIIPAGTKVSTFFRHNTSKKYTEIVIQTNTSAIVRSAIIFAEQIFANESEICSPANPTNALVFPLKLTKNVAVNLNIKALVGNSGNSSQYQVFELSKRLPKFCNYMLVGSLAQFGIPQPTSVLTFYVKERIPRFVRWVSQSFIIDERVLEGFERETSALNISFVNLADGKPLVLDINIQLEGKVLIKTDNMEVAGDIIQDLCSFMNIQELESYADFPKEMEELKDVIKKVNDYNEVRLHLAADMAEAIRNAKIFVVKAEDARILGDMRIMKKMYSNLYIENRNLVGELIKRNTNHEALLAGLKQINNMINKASNLRFGAPKAKVVSLCRAAIKSNNIFSLIQIMQTGKEGS